MVNICFSIPGYTHLYRSLLRFTKIHSAEAKEMLYMLNTANLDGFMACHPDMRMMESGPVEFCRRLDKFRRPYRTEVQLYKSMLALYRNIDNRYITCAQREAVAWLRYMIGEIEYRFYKAYGMEIDDKRTVYTECAYRLEPREDEPSVCLMHEWVYLPTA